MRTRSARRKTIWLFLLIIFSGFSADAVEIQLKPQVHCQGTLVTLGDVAQIRGTDEQQAARLSQLELFPAPAAGTPRVLRVREVQELLQLHGVMLLDYRFSGATEVVLQAGSADTEQSAMHAAAQFTSPLAGGDAGEAGGAGDEHLQRRVERAILDYLNKIDSSAGWQVTVMLDATVEKQLSGARYSRLQVSGGQAPWVGTQQYHITAPSLAGVARASVQAEVGLPQRIVVAARALQRDEVLRLTDLQLQPFDASNTTLETLPRLEDAVGKQLQRSLAAGQPVDGRYLRRPFLVEARQMVTVVARAAGVQVRTTARALESGSEGDVVLVESMLQDDSRGRTRPRRFQARVVGLHEVEIYARGASVAASSPQAKRPGLLRPPADAAQLDATVSTAR